MPHHPADREICACVVCRDLMVVHKEMSKVIIYCYDILSTCIIYYTVDLAAAHLYNIYTHYIYYIPITMYNIYIILLLLLAAASAVLMMCCCCSVLRYEYYNIREYYYTSAEGLARHQRKSKFPCLCV